MKFALKKKVVFTKRNGFAMIEIMVSMVILVMLVKSVQLPLEVSLGGIYWSPTRPMVNIDGETYYVGDLVQGYEIIKIERESVVFWSKSGGETVINMYETLPRWID